MVDIETPSGDAAEQAQALREVGEDAGGLGPEAPEADAAEQRRGVLDADEAPVAGGPDADPGRAYDEERPVDLDEDDYR